MEENRGVVSIHFKVVRSLKKFKITLKEAIFTSNNMLIVCDMVLMGAFNPSDKEISDQG